MMESTFQVVSEVRTASRKGRTVMITSNRVAGAMSHSGNQRRARVMRGRRRRCARLTAGTVGAGTAMLTPLQAEDGSRRADVLPPPAFRLSVLDAGLAEGGDPGHVGLALRIAIERIGQALPLTGGR